MNKFGALRAHLRQSHGFLHQLWFSLALVRSRVRGRALLLELARYFSGSPAILVASGARGTRMTSCRLHLLLPLWMRALREQALSLMLNWRTWQLSLRRLPMQQLGVALPTRTNMIPPAGRDC